MKNRRNYYRVLHIQPDAPAALVRASYRTLMQKLKTHPDLGGDEWDACCLNEAYAVISDPVRRARYDRENGYLYTAGRHGKVDPSVAGARAEQTAADAGFGFAGSGESPGPEASECPFCGLTQVNFRHRGKPPPCSGCRSPQQLPNQDYLLNTTERSLWRASQEQAIRFYTRWPQAEPHHGRITDLSPKGVGMRSSLRLSPDAIIKVEGAKLQGVVRILNCHPDPVGSGKQFRAGGQFVTLEFSTLQGNFFSVKI